MQKPFAFIGAAILAIYVFFTVFGALGGKVPGVEGTAVEAPQMRGCMRRLEREGAEEWQARDTCTCMLNEFDNRGLSLMDAMSEEHFDEMSEITQVCAERSGITPQY